MKKAECNQKNQRIQVFARCRPLNGIEKKAFSPSIVEVSTKKNIIVVKDRNANKEFPFDRVFPPDAEQISVYKAVVEPLIKEVLMGYNCTVFAYGQTGTGKTYTMEGERSDSHCSWEEDPGAGIIPRSIHQLFEELNKGENIEFSVRVSFLELYNEELFDLLSSTELSRLRLFEDSTKKGSVIIQGLEEIIVNRKDEVYTILEKGAARRQTAATMLNASSSRSHTVFSVTVHIKESSEGEDLLKTGKLNLVDLAGSENVGRSGAVDKRAREAGNINQSLLTLGRVITALTEKQPHVPYRESKLTRLLQDSLGGRTKTSIIATISPALCNFDETHSTLDYATKAKSITIKPEVNQKMTKRALIKEYTDEIERLRKDLVALRSKDGFYIDSENYSNLLVEIAEKNDVVKELSEKIEILSGKKVKIEELFNLTKEELTMMSEKFNEISNKYENTAAELSNTTNALERTKQVLTETVLERDEKQYLIHIQANTEKKLSQQAQKLLHVAAETTSDVDRLHAKIDRKSTVEKTNEEKCKDFRLNLPKELASLDDFVSQSEKQQAALLSDVKEDLEKLVQSVQSIIEEKDDFSNQLLCLVKSHYGNLLSDLTSDAEFETRRANSFFEESKHQKETVLSKLSLFSSEILPEVIQKMNSRNFEMEKWFFDKQVQLSEKIEEQKRALVKNCEYRKKLQHSIKESFDALYKGYEQVAADFKQQLATRSKHEENFENDLYKLVEQWKEVKNVSQNDILLVPELENNLLKTQNVKNSFNTLCNAEDVLEENLSTLNSFSSLVNISHKEQFSLMQANVQQSQENAVVEFEKFAKEHQEDLKAELVEIEAAFNKCFTSASENLKSKEKKLTEINSSVKDCVNTRTDLFNTQLKQTQKNIYTTKDKINESESLLSSASSTVKNGLLKIDTECEKFVSEDLQKDIPTGTTPQRKNYCYPQILAATSPHDRILQRYRSQLAVDTAVAINLPLDSSFNELDELKESPASIDSSNDATDVRNTSFSSDEFVACDTDSCHSSMSDLSISSLRNNKENQKCPAKPSRLPKKIKPSKAFAKPDPPSSRKPLVISNSTVTEQCDS